MTIIVIGNGPSVLEHELESVIDRFDEVVRINHYIPNSHVGCKLTTFIVSDYKPKFYPEVLVKAHKIIIVGNTITPYNSNSNATILEMSCINSHLKDMGFNKIYTIPWASTGIITLMNLLLENKHDKIVIHGFDGLKCGEREHYFDNKLRKKNALEHSTTLEQRFIDYYVAQGRIITLHDYMKSSIESMSK